MDSGRRRGRLIVCIIIGRMVLQRPAVSTPLSTHSILGSIEPGIAVCCVSPIRVGHPLATEVIFRVHCGLIGGGRRARICIGDARKRRLRTYCQAAEDDRGEEQFGSTCINCHGFLHEPLRPFPTVLTP